MRATSAGSGRLLLIVAVLVGHAEGQVGRRVPSPVAWKTTGGAEVHVVRGTEFRVGVEASVAPGWHLYGLETEPDGPVATEFSVPEEAAAELVSVAGERPMRSRDAVTGGFVSAYVGQAKFTLRLQLRAGASGGRVAVPILVRFQACNERMCLPPREEQLHSEILVQP